MTLGQMLLGTVAKWKDKPALVTVGKNASTLSYGEVLDQVRGYAGVLRRLGLKRGDRVGIISENCPEWALVDWTCQCLGFVVVPVFPTLPADQALFILRDAGARVVVAGSEEQANKVRPLDGATVVLLKALDAQASGEALGKAELEAEVAAGDPETICTIIYTSGTTGDPKGVLLPHRAMVHVCVAGKQHIHLSEEDRFLSFLPMSHVYERVAGQFLPVYLGATICYSKSLMALATEMTEFQPTIMLVVPRFLENFRGRILDGVAKAKPIRQKLFHAAVDQGVKRARGGSAPFFPLLDKLVGAKIRERTGGSLRFFVSGGAALSPDVAEFYMSMGLVVLQGYGLTETSGGTCVNTPENNRYWTVGEPLQMEAKIAPDGEILFRGPGNMTGYHNRPAETAAAIDSDGWFHTGDIGEFEGKNLKITDRKKNILVLANGKNVAPQKIENLLRFSPYIQEAVVLGDGMDHCIALIVPRFEAVRAHLKLGESEVLSGNADAVGLIKKEVDSVNKGLADFEKVKRHAILDTAFSVDSGELTPTLKVKRRVISQRFAETIARLR